MAALNDGQFLPVILCSHCFDSNPSITSFNIITGYGCALLKDPELLKDLTSTIRRNFPSGFSVSAKIRVQKPLDITIDLVRQLEKCGVTFITIHGRTPTQKIGEPSNADYLAEIKKSIAIPMIANGDVKTLDEANELHQKTKCDGAMSARGILSNPTLFAGTDSPSVSCLQNWIDIVDANPNVTFQCFHHHLSFMMEKMLRKKQRVAFNQLTNKQQVCDFLEQHFGIVTDRSKTGGEPVVCEYDDSKFRQRSTDHDREIKRIEYNSGNNAGKFFESQLANDEGDSDCDDDDDGVGFSNIFDT